jgi:hypothetical protein
MRPATLRSSTILAVAIALCGGLGLAPANARTGEDPAQVTSVIGDARASDAPLAERTAVGERETVATGEDGKCSMLVDGDVVIQLCEHSTLALHRDAAQGRRIIEVDAGSVHVIAAPRLSEERVEIHTPAAIAVLLGTIVHVLVDEATGDSTIASIHSAVRVRSASEGFDQETTLNPAQQITVRRGAPPPAQPEQLGPGQIAELTSCIADLREAALERERRNHLDDAVTRMAESDVSRIRYVEREGSSPARIAPRPEEQLPGEDPNDLGNICTPFDCGGYGGQRQQQDIQQVMDLLP